MQLLRNPKIQSSIHKSIFALAAIPLTTVLLLGAGRSTRLESSPKNSTTTLRDLESRASAIRQLANLPIIFEPNRGQTDPSVSFFSHIGGTRLFLTRDSAVFSIQRDPKQAPAIVKMRMLNSSLPGLAGRTIDQGVDRLPGISNYFVGRDATKWVSDVPQFRKVTRPGIYPGVDMVFYGNQRQLEYDFVVAPGADSSRIELAYEGVDSIRTNPSGDLVLNTSVGPFLQKKPRVYQDLNGKQVEVAASYRLSAGNKVRFEMASYDRNRPLVIDPVIVFNALAGSSYDEHPSGVATDSSGNIYVTGFTLGADFPLANAYQSSVIGLPTAGVHKSVVFKLSSNGSTLLYSTYLGGESDDRGLGVAVDGSGNAIVAGSTSSTQFPVVNAFQSTFAGLFDTTVTKLNSAGNALIYSTYFGGTSDDEPLGISVDVGGNVLVAGQTSSNNLPVSGGAYQTTSGGGYDCFVGRFNPSGGRLFSTYLGGSGDDQCNGVATDSSGNAYVTGSTFSANFPHTPGAAKGTYGGNQDGFIAKIGSSGTSLAYSTFVGGSNSDVGRSIAVDSSFNAYVTGGTVSTDLPTTPGAAQTTLRGFQGAYVTKLNATGTAFIYLTYLGGRKSEFGNSIVVDSSGVAYVGGGTLSDDFPTVSPVVGSKPGVGGIIMKSSNGTTSFSPADSGISANLPSALAISTSNGVIMAASNASLFESNNAGISWVNTSLTPITKIVASRPSNVFYATANSTSATIRRSTDGGVFWSPISANVGLTISAISVSQTDSNTLILATGTTNGLYLSSNQGANWSLVSGGISNLVMTTVLFTTDVNNAIACSSETTGGLYRTLNGGSTWFLANAGFASGSCNQLVLDPNNTSTVYLSADTGLFKSTNAGASWTKLTGLPIANAVIAVAPSNSNIVVAGSPNAGGIFKSTDGGINWTASADLTSTPVKALAISPSDSNTVYAGIDINGEEAGFVTAMNSAGTGYLYSTYLGGSFGGNFQGVQAITLDPSGNLIAAGQTASTSYAATPGALSAGYGGFDMFVTKLSSANGGCSVTLTVPSIVAYAAGGAFPIEVFAPSGCAWTATPGASWVSLTGTSGTTASASTRVVIAANSGSARSTTVSFNTGQSLTINQVAGTCAYSFGPSTGSIVSNGGNGSASLNVATGCAWSAVSSEPWLTISNSSGSGSAAISYSVAPNPGTSARSAYVAVGSVLYTLTENGQSTTCSYSISPSTFYVGPRGTNSNLTGTVSVTAPAGCAWSASPGSSNITMITSSGSGNGTATYTVSANTANTTGIGTNYSINVAGQTQTVRQASGGLPGSIGVFRNGEWWMDTNAHDTFIWPQDRLQILGQAGDIPVIGDWDNTGWRRMGIFRSGQWWLDINGDGTWTPDKDKLYIFGQAGDIPVVGDWDSTGVERIGIFRSGQWWLDINGDFNFVWPIDALKLLGQAGDTPIWGDWDGTGRRRPGVFRHGEWWMAGSDFQWINGRDQLKIYGQAGDVPIVGDWDHTGRLRIGIFRNGQWWLDTTGDFAFTWPIDKLYILGQSGDTPIVNNWW